MYGSSQPYSCMMPPSPAARSFNRRGHTCSWRSSSSQPTGGSLRSECGLSFPESMWVVLLTASVMSCFLYLLFGCLEQAASPVDGPVCVGVMSCFLYLLFGCLEQAASPVDGPVCVGVMSCFLYLVFGCLEQAASPVDGPVCVGDVAALFLSPGLTCYSSSTSDVWAVCVFAVPSLLAQHLVFLYTPHGHPTPTLCSLSCTDACSRA